MYQFETEIRVRYAETDQMGYVYYGHYLTYFEVARVESLRALGYAYKKLEEAGVMLPVLEQNTKYFRPAKYDDLITIKTFIRKQPEIKLIFEYRCYNQEKELLTTAETTLVFVDKVTGKPTRPPKVMQELFQPFFSGDNE